MIIRTAERADLRSLHSWVTDADACRIWAGPNVHFPFTLDSLCEDIRFEPNNTHCLIGAKGELFGLGQIMTVSDARLHLARVIIHPKMRGKQLGAVFCTALIRETYAKFGERELILKVYRDNLRAINLYQRLGFKTTDEPEHTSSNSNSVSMILSIRDFCQVHG